MRALDGRRSWADEPASDRHHVAVSADCTHDATSPGLLPAVVGMQKLGAHFRAEAVRVAEDEGWL
jgi:hypothetical protein